MPEVRSCLERPDGSLTYSDRDHFDFFIIVKAIHG